MTVPERGGLFRPRIEKPGVSAPVVVERITINAGLGALLTNSNQVGVLQDKIDRLEKDGYEIVSVVNSQKSVWNHVKIFLCAVFTLMIYVPSGDLIVVSRRKS